MVWKCWRPNRYARSMGWPELVRLGFGAELPAGATAVGFEGDWLDRFGALLGDRGRWAERQFVLPGPPPRIHDPERLLDHALELPNAVWRLQERHRRPGRVACCWPSVTPRSPTRSVKGWSGSVSIREPAPSSTILRRGCVHCWRQTRNGKSPTRRSATSAGPAWDASVLEGRVRPLLKHRVRLEVEPFLRTMRRRLDRDRNRIHEYHNDLHLVAQKKLAALAGSSGEKAENDRKREMLRDRGDRAGILRQARRSAPQLCASRDDRMGAGTGVVCSGAALRSAGQTP